MKYVSLVLIFVVSSAYAEQQSIVIPAIHIPAKHIPAIHIPGSYIPAKQTPFGLIEAIEIPAVDIPGFDIPAVDTTASNFVYGDFRADKVEAYNRVAPVAKLQPPKMEKTYTEKRVEKYLVSTKWATKEMVNLFTRYDADGFGVLTWDEVETFQRFLFNKYKYLTNNTALRPDAFLARGGGDCEDFALVSCEFFRFWGWDAYVAGFFNAKEGHAVCFVKAMLDPIVNTSLSDFQVSSSPLFHRDLAEVGFVGSLVAV